MATEADRPELEDLCSEITMLQHRSELTADTYLDFQSKVVHLVFNNATDEIVEENRDKATFYFEAFLDIQIKIGRLSRRLTELTGT